MKKHNKSNERIKRKYFIYLKEARRYSEATIDVAAKALNRFETYTGYKDFKTFRSEQAIGFKKRLAGERAVQSGKPLSKATQHTTLTQLKRFFQWLAWEPGYKSRLQMSDADFFNMSRKDGRVATARRNQQAPTLEQIKHVLQAMSKGTELEQRNQALIAFALLSGARDSAIASFKLRHVDVVGGVVHQDAREVATKFSKSFDSFFFPVGDEVREIVVEWVRYLREVKLWGNDDPLFPATEIAVGTSRQFEAVGLARRHWSTATPIRRVFREAFVAAGLPYFNPHSFRNTLVRLGEERCRTPEEFKAWSQNLGHEQVLTTFMSYGEVSCVRQGELVQGLGEKMKAEAEVATIVEEVFRRVKAR